MAVSRRPQDAAESGGAAAELAAEGYYFREIDFCRTRLLSLGRGPHVHLHAREHSACTGFITAAHKTGRYSMFDGLH